MADDGKIISNLDLGMEPNGEDTGPSAGIITQYIKDLSVENPNAPESYQWDDVPEMDVQFNIASRPVATDVHEVELKIAVTSKSKKGTAYIIDLSYCGLVGMRNLDEGQAHAFTYAEAPRILFPFARRVIADAVRDAGYAPLMLEPLDFNGLYIQQMMAQQQAAEGAPAGNA
jgi:preprotein translocase subunit SecB